MRKHVFLLAMLLSLPFAMPLLAQKDTKARTILDAMSERYKKTPAFKAAFFLEMFNGKQLMDKMEGNVTVMGDKYHLNLGDQEIYNNRVNVWTYLKSEKEVTIAEYEPDPDDLSITQIYNIYKTDFKYLFIEEKTEAGKVLEVVELSPQKKNVNYFKIRLEIGKQDRLLKRWEVFEKTGKRHVYTIKDFNSSVKVTDADFVFDMARHPGVEVVDLR